MSYPHTLEELTSAYNSQKEQIKQLKEELKSQKGTSDYLRNQSNFMHDKAKEKNKEIQSLKSQLEETQNVVFDQTLENGDLKLRNEKLQKVIDGIILLISAYKLTDTDLQILKSILSKLEASA